MPVVNHQLIDRAFEFETSALRTGSHAFLIYPMNILVHIARHIINAVSYTHLDVYKRQI